MDKWQNLPVDPINHVVRYKGEYTADIIIQALNQKNSPIYGIKLTNAYPTSVNSISLDNAASDVTSELQVNFAYDTIEAHGAIDAMVAGADGLLDGLRNLF